jgi:hypothetical protein
MSVQAFICLVREDEEQRIFTSSFPVVIQAGGISGYCRTPVTRQGFLPRDVSTSAVSSPDSHALTPYERDRRL